GFQDSVVKALAEMHTLQKGQLETFANNLADGVTAIDGRVGGMATDLQTSGDAAKDSANQRHVVLQSMVDSKLSELRTASTESDKALREEVIVSVKAMGEVLSANIGRLAETQRDRLEVVAKE